MPPFPTSPAGHFVTQIFDRTLLHPDFAPNLCWSEIQRGREHGEGRGQKSADRTEDSRGERDQRAKGTDFACRKPRIDPWHHMVPQATPRETPEHHLHTQTHNYSTIGDGPSTIPHPKKDKSRLSGRACIHRMDLKHMVVTKRWDLTLRQAAERAVVGSGMKETAGLSVGSINCVVMGSRGHWRGLTKERD